MDPQHDRWMERIRFVEIGGTRILLSDFAGIREVSELQRTTRLGMELVRTQPLKSLLILVDVTGVEYSLEAFAILQQSVAANRPYVKARAVVGLPKIAVIPFEIVSRVAGGPLERFESKEAAVEWLLSHR